MASKQRYIPEQLVDGQWHRLIPQPTYRHAVEALDQDALTKNVAGTRILLDIGEVDLTSRDVLLGLMPYDPLLQTMFDFARTQGMAGIGEIAGGLTAQESWDEQRKTLQANVRQGIGMSSQWKQKQPLSVEGGSHRATALADCLPLLQLALQSLLTNAEAEHGAMTEDGKDNLEDQVFTQFRGMLAKLGVAEEEMDRAGLRPDRSGQ